MKALSKSASLVLWGTSSVAGLIAVSIGIAALVKNDYPVFLFVLVIISAVSALVAALGFYATLRQC